MAKPQERVIDRWRAARAARTGPGRCGCGYGWSAAQREDAAWLAPPARRAGTLWARGRQWRGGEDDHQAVAGPGRPRRAGWERWLRGPWAPGALGRLCPRRRPRRWTAPRARRT